MAAQLAAFHYEICGAIHQFAAKGKTKCSSCGARALRFSWSFFELTGCGAAVRGYDPRWRMTMAFYSNERMG
jgi:hypothetical protein